MARLLGADEQASRQAGGHLAAVLQECIQETLAGGFIQLALADRSRIVGCVWVDVWKLAVSGGMESCQQLACFTMMGATVYLVDQPLCGTHGGGVGGDNNVLHTPNLCHPDGSAVRLGFSCRWRG